MPWAVPHRSEGPTIWHDNFNFEYLPVPEGDWQGIGGPNEWCAGMAVEKVGAQGATECYLREGDWPLCPRPKESSGPYANTDDTILAGWRTGSDDPCFRGFECDGANFEYKLKGEDKVSDDPVIDDFYNAPCATVGLYYDSRNLKIFEGSQAVMRFQVNQKLAENKVSYLASVAREILTAHAITGIIAGAWEVYANGVSQILSRAQTFASDFPPLAPPPPSYP